MKQISCAQSEHQSKQMITRHEWFLAQVDALAPWQQLVDALSPVYSDAASERRQSPIVLGCMLRIYFLQQWYALADEALEDIIYYSQAMRDFVGIDPAIESVPDATTLPRSRCLLEKQSLSIFEEINVHLTKKVLFMHEGTIVDATSMAAIFYDCARRCDMPVIHTRVVYSEDGADGGVFIEKLPALRQLTENGIYSQFDDNVLPAEGEAVICKQYPSVFFGTPLVSMLIPKGVDTVVLTGCSTSGCTRASVVDAISYGFRIIVSRECVGDHRPDPHEASLFNLHAKYDDVMSINNEVIKNFEGHNQCSP